MKNILRRNILALMIGVTSITLVAPMILDMPAFAKNGSDDGGNSGSDGDSDSGSSGSGSSGSGSSGDSDGDDSGSDSDSDSDSDDSNSDSDDSDDDNDDNDDSKKDKDAKKADQKAAKSASRPTVTLSLNASELAAVKAGTSVVVDQLGRQLEVSVRTVNGVTVVSGKPHGGASKRNPGPITSVSVVSAASVPGDDDGTPDQGQGDN